MKYSASYPGRSWTNGGQSESVLDITVENNEGKDIYLESLTCQLASGLGSVYYPRDNAYVNGGGGVCTATLSWSGGSTTATVSQSIGVESSGNPSSGYYYNCGGSSDYNVTFNFSGILITNGSSMTFSIDNHESDSGHVLTSRNATNQVVTGTFRGRDIYGEIINVSISAANSTVRYNESTTLSSSGSLSGTPSGTQLSTSYEIISGSATLSGENLNFVKSQVKVRVTKTATCSGYSGSLTATAETTVNCKLNTPIIQGQSFISIGNTVNFTTSSTVENPSGVTLNWSASTTDLQSYKEITMPYAVTESTNPGSTISRIGFRLYLTKQGYVESDTSGNFSTVLYEPRDMSSGTGGEFNPSFSYQSASGDAYQIDQNFKEVVIVKQGLETSKIYISLQRFSPELNLGRFNYYRVSFIDVNSSSALYSREASWSPNQIGIISIDLGKTGTSLIGKTVKVKLECLCRWPESSTNIYGPKSSAIFETPVSFLVGGLPLTPEMIYPYGDLSTCNIRPRILFKVGNPDYLDDEPITDIFVTNVRLFNSTTSYSYRNNPSDFAVVRGGADSSGNILNNSVVAYYFPEGYQTSNSAVKVFCKNRYGESKTAATFNVNRLDDPIAPLSGEILNQLTLSTFKKKLILHPLSGPQDWLDSYRTILEDAGLLSSNFWEDPDDDYTWQVSPMTGYTIPRLKDLYDYIVDNYGYHRNLSTGSYRDFFDFIDVGETTSIITAKLFNPPPSNKPFDVEGNYFSPKGNYFTFAYYALKYLM